jgi:hypothetical protein
MAEGRHNAQDGRCRYTLGAERCPAVGSVRVGDWWVCESHRYWAENPRDPDRVADGQIALEVEQHQARLLQGKGREAVSASRAAALDEMRGVLAAGEPGRRDPWRRFRVLAVQVYRVRRAELERKGIDRQAAHERALEDLGETIARRAVLG